MTCPLISSNFFIFSFGESFFMKSPVSNDFSIVFPAFLFQSLFAIRLISFGVCSSGKRESKSSDL